MSLATRLTPAAAAALLLASCGGGTISDTTTAPPPVKPGSGWAVDGYLNGATAVCDTNGNGIADAGELTVSTDSKGQFIFPLGCTSGVAVYGGTDVDTGLLFKGVLRAPAGATVATPLTTLLVGGLTAAQLKTALGLGAGTDLTGSDPALRINGGLVNGDLLRKSLAVEQLIQKTTEMFAGLAGAAGDSVLQAIYTEVAGAFADALKPGGVLVTGTTLDSSLVASLVKAATLRVAAAPTVSAGVKTALASVNADSLAQVTSGALKAEAEAILKAADADVVAVSKAKQSDDTISAYVKTHATALAAAPSAATAALATELTSLVGGGSSGGGGGTGGGTIVAGQVLVSFDEATPTTLTDFGGNASSIVADPANSSNKVGKVVKPVAANLWAGTTFWTGANLPFSATVTKLSLRVWSPAVGVHVRLKLEDKADGTHSVETEALSTVAGAWETLVFDFGTQAAGTAALNLAYAYNTASVFFDFGLGSDGTAPMPAERSYYFENLTFAPTVVVPPAPTDYLAVGADSIALANGTASTSYTMTQFQSAAGIAVSWPLPAPMTLKFKLIEVGTYTLPANLKIAAAVEIAETTATGQGLLRAYVDGVSVTKTATGLDVSIPTGAGSLVYGVSSDGKKKAIVDFSKDVTGIASSLATSATVGNTILLGSVVNYGIEKVSNDFTGIYSLRGKYKVSIVLTDLPLRALDGSRLTPLTISVPTTLDSSGGIATTKSVSGTGLVGYISLVD